MRIDVIVATHGHTKWKKLAMQRAIPSCWDQADTILMYHEVDKTLAQVRNFAARESEADVLVFLDADDELAPGYISAMKHAAKRNGRWALLVPRIQYVRGRSESPPDFPNRQASMEELNWCVIGTGVPRWLFEQVGGFREWPVYEDYELWLRCLRAGSTLADVPDAIYRAFMSDGSRNEPAQAVKAQACQQIQAEHKAAMSYESAIREERAVKAESPAGIERAQHPESPEARERAIDGEGAMKLERAVECEGAENRERAGSGESADRLERD